jgi:hypothetical protein
MAYLYLGMLYHWELLPIGPSCQQKIGYLDLQGHGSSIID